MAIENASAPAPDDPYFPTIDAAVEDEWRKLDEQLDPERKRPGFYQVQIWAHCSNPVDGYKVFLTPGG